MEYSLIKSGNHYYMLGKYIKINCKINSKKYRAEFKDYQQDILKGYCFKVKDDVSICGKYSIEYVINLLIDAILRQIYSKIIILCSGFEMFEGVDNVINRMCTHDQNALIISDKKIDVNCGQIFLNLKTHNNFIVNDEVKNSFNEKVVYTKFITNMLVLESLVLQFKAKKSKINYGRDRSVNIGITFNLLEDGPHGLVVGMTGSGKSVLLKTIIYKLCERYSPENLVLCLVDFKGTALIDEVRGLPHITSTYSNLDDKNYSRVVTTIEKELIKRQKLLSENKLNEFDDSLGIPRLVILIDEFAEVKIGAENLVSKLASVARIGRSLGIHLILSMQKTSGILSDELMSNISYVICLKVNSKQQSIELVGVDDCFYFTKPGEAVFLKNERLERFKVFNCDDYFIDKPVLQVSEENLYSSYVLKNLANTKSSKYFLWKGLFEDGLSVGVNVDEVSMCCSFVKKLKYQNHLIVGKEKTGKTSLIKLIINQQNCKTFCISKDGSLKGIVSYFADDPRMFNLFLSIVKNENMKCYFIIDNIRSFDNDEVQMFINDVLSLKYSNIKLIVSASFSEHTVNRFSKLFDNIYAFKLVDKSDYFNIFHERVSYDLGDSLGRGVLNDNGILKIFQTCLPEKFNISHWQTLPNGIYYVSDLKKVDENNLVVIVDREINLNCKIILKSESSNEEISEYLNQGFNVFSACYEFEYDYRIFKSSYGFMVNISTNQQALMWIDSIIDV